MSEEAAKVTVFCTSEALAARIREADREKRLKEVITEAKRPVYEYDTAIYVHSPIVRDLRPLPKDAPPLAQMQRSLRTQAGHLDTPLFEEPLGRQVGNLRDAIREGLVLGVVFVEYLGFTKVYSDMRQWPVPRLSGYVVEVLEGLLPVWELLKPGFLFKPQPEPDTILEPTPEARPWIEALRPFFSELVGGRIEACDPAVRDGSPEAVEAVEKMTEQLYSHPITGIHPTRFHGPILVRIEPVLRNKVGDWLGCAVRIGQGAVLLLPQCRDEAAKAALVVKLATELWEPIQEWLRPRPTPVTTPAPIDPNLWQSSNAAFPWLRAILAVALLIVLVFFAVMGAWQWGDGDNLLQKIGNCKWLLAFVPLAAPLVFRLILGREGWSQVKKKWHSWRGEV